MTTEARAEKISRAPTPLSFRYFESMYLSIWFTMLHNIGAISAMRNQFDIDYWFSSTSSIIIKFLSKNALLYVKKIETNTIITKIAIKIFDFLSISLYYNNNLTNLLWKLSVLWFAYLSRMKINTGKIKVLIIFIKFFILGC